MLRRIVVSTPSSFDSDKIIARTPLPCSSVLLGSQTVFANHLGCRGTPGRGRRGGLIKSHFIASLVWYSHSVHSLEWCRCRVKQQPVSTSCSPNPPSKTSQAFNSSSGVPRSPNSRQVAGGRRDGGDFRLIPIDARWQQVAGIPSSFPSSDPDGRFALCPGGRVVALVHLREPMPRAREPEAVLTTE